MRSTRTLPALWTGPVHNAGAIVLQAGSGSGNSPPWRAGLDLPIAIGFHNGRALSLYALYALYTLYKKLNLASELPATVPQGRRQQQGHHVYARPARGCPLGRRLRPARSPPSDLMMRPQQAAAAAAGSSSGSAGPTQVGVGIYIADTCNHYPLYQVPLPRATVPVAGYVEPYAVGLASLARSS